MIATLCHFRCFLCYALHKSFPLLVFSWFLSSGHVCMLKLYLLLWIIISSCVIYEYGWTENLLRGSLTLYLGYSVHQVYIIEHYTSKVCKVIFTFVSQVFKLFKFCLMGYSGVLRISKCLVEFFTNNYMPLLIISNCFQYVLFIVFLK